MTGIRFSVVTPENAGSFVGQRPPSGTPPSGPLDPGSGGPDDPGMEALKARMTAIEGQVTRLEARFDKVDERLRGVEVKLGEISGKLDLLAGKIPSWWHAPVSIIGTISVLATLAGIAYRYLPRMPLP